MTSVVLSRSQSSWGIIRVRGAVHPIRNGRNCKHGELEPVQLRGCRACCCWLLPQMQGGGNLYRTRQISWAHGQLSDVCPQALSPKPHARLMAAFGAKQRLKKENGKREEKKKWHRGIADTPKPKPGLRNSLAAEPNNQNLQYHHHPHHHTPVPLSIRRALAPGVSTVSSRPAGPKNLGEERKRRHLDQRCNHLSRHREQSALKGHLSW